MTYGYILKTRGKMGGKGEANHLKVNQCVNETNWLNVGSRMGSKEASQHSKGESRIERGVKTGVRGGVK